MKKASNILFLVAKIMSFITGGILIACAILFFIFGSDYFKDLIVNNTPANQDPEAVGLVYQATFMGFGIWFAVWGALLFVNGAISNLGLKEPTESHMIANIVFGILSLAEVNLVGAIFGLIALKKEENAKRDFE